jgi:hypothetical protein
VVNYRIKKVEKYQKQSSNVIIPAANAISSFSSMLLLAMIRNTSDARRTRSTGLTNAVSTDRLYIYNIRERSRMERSRLHAILT